MSTDFDFGKIGKRMPYKVPDGFFTEMEKNVRKKTQTPAKRRKSVYRRISVAALSAAAAAAAILFLPDTDTVKSPGTGIDDVEQAFGKLSYEDQTRLLDFYQEDIFINDQNNM